jgi:hypothetical protein
MRHPSRYALAWHDRADGTPPTGRWKAFQSIGQAKRAVANALAGPKRAKARRKNKKPVTKTNTAGNENVPSAGHRNVTSPNKKPATKTGLLSSYTGSPSRASAARPKAAQASERGPLWLVQATKAGREDAATDFRTRGEINRDRCLGALDEVIARQSARAAS